LLATVDLFGSGGGELLDGFLSLSVLLRQALVL
jgi:hypothetical protein